MTVPSGSAGPWSPANDTEVRLDEAFRRDDRREFFRILTGAMLYLPQMSHPVAGWGPITLTVQRQPYVVAFTSAEALRRAVSGAHSYLAIPYDELRRAWPDDAVKLVVNPGIEMDVWTTIEGVAEVADGTTEVHTGPEIAAAATLTEREVEDALSGALDRVVEDYLDGLVAGRVVLPTTGPARSLAQPGFPWRLETVDGVPTIVVYGGGAATPELAHSIAVEFVELARSWPDPAVQLSVNPGTPLAFLVPGEAVSALAAGDRQDTA